MNIRSLCFLTIGLMIGLLLGGGAYFLLSANKSATVAPNTLTTVIKPPVMVSASKEGSTAPTADTTSSPQSEADSVPAPVYKYNAQGQIQAIVYPDGSVYTYQYDASGDKIRETSRTGKTWSYAYDQNHHPVAVIDPEGRVTHKAVAPSTPNAN